MNTLIPRGSGQLSGSSRAQSCLPLRGSVRLQPQDGAAAGSPSFRTDLSDVRPPSRGREGCSSLPVLAATLCTRTLWQLPYARPLSATALVLKDTAGGYNCCGHHRVPGPLPPQQLGRLNSMLMKLEARCELPRMPAQSFFSLPPVSKNLSQRLCRGGFHLTSLTSIGPTTDWCHICRGSYWHLDLVGW